MANRSFRLKRSRLALVFQLSIFVLLIVLLLQTLSLWLCGLCMVLGGAAYVYRLKLPQAIFFEHLDAREWSLSHLKSKHVQRVSIRHVIDHQLYIVIYFQHVKDKPLVIWIDQLSLKQWKALKTLAKLI